MNDIISQIAERNLDHILENVFESIKPKDILSLAHASRHHRNLVNKFELLPFALSNEDNQMELDDEFEDLIDKELRACTNKFMTVADSISRYLYRQQREIGMKTKKGSFLRTRHIIKEITNIDAQLGQPLQKYTYQHFTIFEKKLIILEPYGWISIIDTETWTLSEQFRAYERDVFTVWLGVVATDSLLICSIWSADAWRTKIFDYGGNLQQILPSGELHLNPSNTEQLFISSNSNDQVVSYNLSEALARPLFDEDFGEHEFFFDFELGPGQFGLFTWKPNVDVQGDYVVVEWNTVSTLNLQERNRELWVYSTKTGDEVAEIKIENNNGKKPIWTKWFIHNEEQFLIVVHEIIEIHRVLKFFCEVEFEKVYFCNRIRPVDVRGAPLQFLDIRATVTNDGVILGFSTKDEPVRLVSLSFAELLTYRDEDKLYLESNITTLEDTKTPYLSCIENSILLFRIEDANIEELDFLHIEKRAQFKLFEKMGLSTRSSSAFKIRRKMNLNDRLKELDEKCAESERRSKEARTSLLQNSDNVSYRSRSSFTDKDRFSCYTPKYRNSGSYSSTTGSSSEKTFGNLSRYSIDSGSSYRAPSSGFTSSYSPSSYSSYSSSTSSSSKHSSPYLSSSSSSLPTHTGRYSSSTSSYSPRYMPSSSNSADGSFKRSSKYGSYR